jgi:hypothetical protein
MTAQPDELDARARELEAERARPMARWEVKNAELIEDVEYLLGTDSPEGIAARLGCSSPRNLSQRLRRAGRGDLARLFDRRVTS